MKFHFLFTLFISYCLFHQVFAQSPSIISPTYLGIPPSLENCKKYKENSDWLPDAYIHNATCACEKLPDDANANIIRQVLQERLLLTPPAIKQEAIVKKQQFLKKEISKRQYNHFIKKRLTPIIYSDHAIAYSLAGCEGDPAAYFAWKLISTVKINSCKTILLCIKCLGGSCSNCACSW